MRDVVVGVLLGAAVVLQVLAALGVLLVRDAFDRLHYASAPAFASVFVAAAVAVQLGPSIATEKAVLLAVLLVATSPVAAMVLGRATRMALAGRVDVPRDPGGEPG